MTGDSVLDRLRAAQPQAAAVLFPKTGCRLHAMVTSAGYDRRSGGYDWHGLRRGDAPFVLVQHSLAGSGRLRFEGRRFDVAPGDTMLLRFPHDNRYWLERGETWEFFWLCLSGREVVRLWREILAVAGPIARLPAAASARLAELCLAVVEGKAASAAAASEIAYATVMCLTGAILAPGESLAGPRRPVAVERAVALCRARADGGRVGDRVDVARMAEAAGLSRHHFSRVFANSEGMPPARYLLRQRMEHAATLLRTEAVSVKQVALRCGFGDPNYFAKAFRRTYAISPSDFRRSGAFGQAGPMAAAEAMAATPPP